MRFHASRGSMDLSQKDGGLPPDSVVQTIDAILADSERLVRVWHDDSRFSMPGECKIHNGSSTIIHPSESADFSAPGYSPDSDNLSAPIHSVVPRPMTGSGRNGNNIPIVPANPEH